MVSTFLKELFNKSFIKVAMPKSSDPKDFLTPMLISSTLEAKYGTDWLLFLPETLRVCLKKDFNITPNEVLMNKIFATQAVLSNPYFEWDIFEKICLSFNNTVPDFVVIEPLSMTDLVWGYVCIKSLQPGWTPDAEIDNYIGLVMKNEGIVWLPWLAKEMGPVDLINKVKEAYKSVDKMADQDVGIQLDRISVIKEYVNSWMK